MPFTVQGIGVREGLFILFFGAVGVTSSKAALLAALIYTLLSLNGLVGGAIYLWDIRRTTSQSPHAPASSPLNLAGMCGRPVTFSEDRCRLRTGCVAQVMAASTTTPLWSRSMRLPPTLQKPWWINALS